MKLITLTQISVDGVMQGSGGPGEDDRGGFERGGWGRGLGDSEALARIIEFYASADAFLFGRRTFETFAGYWGKMDGSEHPIAAALNSRPRYLASNTVVEPDWEPTTVLSGDIEGAVRELKAGPDGELQVHGSGVLVRWLLAHGLIDELNLMIVPVIVGQGSRMFPEDGPDVALEHVGSQTTAKGVVFQTYRPAGKPAYAS